MTYRIMLPDGSIHKTSVNMRDESFKACPQCGIIKYDSMIGPIYISPDGKENIKGDLNIDHFIGSKACLKDFLGNNFKVAYPTDEEFDEENRNLPEKCPSFD